MQNNAPVIYAYPDLATLRDPSASKLELPGPGDKSATERPDS